MKIIYGGFLQETNTFSPRVCKRENFKIVESGRSILDKLLDTTIFGGMLKPLISAQDVEVIPSIVMQAVSDGPVEREVCDMFLTRLLSDIRDSGKIDGVFLSLHGGMSLTDFDDGIGLILEKIREEVGDSVVIAASADLHANITDRVLRNADILTGYQTFPHTDVYETSVRAATLGLQFLRGEIQPVTAFVKLPLILQSEGCTTTEGPLRELMDYGLSLVSKGEILDFTIYHMQPWLDVQEGGASVVVIAEEEDKAAKHAKEIASRFFDMREQLIYELKSLDDVLDIAVNNTSGTPVILSDSADSPSAGACGDSTEVLGRILERKLDLKTALVIADLEAPSQARQVGVGNTAVFTLGGKMDPQRQKPITLEASVKGIFQGDVLVKCGPMEGVVCHNGKTAVLQVASIDVVVCELPSLNFYPDQFEGFGLSVCDYDLLVVKSPLAYRALFKKYTRNTLMFNVDTPGASSGNLFNFEFKKVPRPIFPFDDVSGYKAGNVMVYRAQGKRR